MSRFAENTTVPVERSKAELDSLLAKHGAQQRGVFNDSLAGKAVVVFSLGQRQMKLSLGFPTLRDILADANASEPRGWTKKKPSEKEAWAQAQLAQVERQRWRGLLLCVKAKLELVADGSSTLEREFLCDILLPDGSTVGESLAPQLAKAYETGQMPPLLPAYAG